jgi:hypothetical protein
MGKKLSDYIGQEYLDMVKRNYERLREVENNPPINLEEIGASIKESVTRLQGHSALTRKERPDVVRAIVWNLDIYDSPEKAWCAMKTALLGKQRGRPIDLPANITVYLLVSKMKYIDKKSRRHYNLILEWMEDEGIINANSGADADEFMRNKFNCFEGTFIMERLFNTFGIIMSDETPPLERKEIICDLVVEHFMK